MKKFNAQFVAAIFFITAVPAKAQYLNSAYFLRGYSYQHEMNPAFMAERNYVSIPMLGNTNISIKSNVEINNFIYKNTPGSEYKLTTFMHQSIDANAFLNDLNDNNKIGLNLKTSILGLGFHAFGGFNTLDINLRANSNINLPYEMFDFMKSGMKSEEGTTYNIEDLKITASSYAEIALGHAHKINENLTIGAKLKFLVGAGYAEANVDKLTATMTQGIWAVAMNGKVNASIKGASITTKKEELTQRQLNLNAQGLGSYKPRQNQFDGLDVNSPGIGGFGFGADLGATYDMKDIVEGLKITASVLDLGFINWKNNLQASNIGNEGFEFNGFKDIAVDNDGNGKTVEDQIDDLSDQFEEMVRFYDDGDQGKRTTALTSTLNFGVEYQMPFYNKLSAGLLSSTHFQDIFSWTEVRLSLNIAPIKWLDASTSIAQSNFGTEAGAVINFHPKGINLFVGTNRIFTKTTKEFIPLKGNADVTFGINITFGNPTKKTIEAPTEVITVE